MRLHEQICGYLRNKMDKKTVVLVFFGKTTKRRIAKILERWRNKCHDIKPRAEMEIWIFDIAGHE